MAKVFPFRGVRYDVSVAGDLSKVVTQPYDKIDAAVMDKYYALSEYNFTRVIKAKEKPGDDEYVNMYSRAREYLKDWMAKGVLKRDEKPALYVYHQVYRVEGETKTRKGFVGAIETKRFGEGVKAHEKTLEGPKADRLNLMRATFSNTGQIFMLYSDPALVISGILDNAIAGREPDARATDDLGENHLLWVVSDPDVCSKVCKAMEDKELFVADGHHRYETACNFFEEKALEGYICDGNENIHNVMLTMVNMDETGLTILPTHRLIFGIEDFNPIRFLTEAKMHFDVTTWRFSEHGGESEARKKFFAQMDAKAESAALGFYAHGEDAYYLLEFNDPKMMDDVLDGRKDEDGNPIVFSPDYKKLDAAILHALLEKFFGIDDDALKAQTNVNYVRGRDEAIERVDNIEKYQCVFLMNPTLIDEVKKVAMAGERMPQKSTDFYPKLLSGMVMNKMICRKDEW